MRVKVRLEVDVPVTIDADDYGDTREDDERLDQDICQLAWDNLCMAEVVDTGDWRPA